MGSGMAKKVTEMELQPVFPTRVIAICISCSLNHTDRKSGHRFIPTWRVSISRQGSRTGKPAWDVPAPLPFLCLTLKEKGCPKPWNSGKISWFCTGANHPRGYFPLHHHRLELDIKLLKISWERSLLVLFLSYYREEKGIPVLRRREGQEEGNTRWSSQEPSSSIDAQTWSRWTGRRRLLELFVYDSLVGQNPPKLNKFDVWYIKIKIHYKIKMHEYMNVGHLSGFGTFPSVWKA